ncbi:MAG: cyclophilin-like family protein [Hyphomicrobiaceae bacterium]
MPTNVLRQSSKRSAKPAAGGRTPAAAARIVLVRAAAVEIRVRLLDTTTADRIWAALPIRSTAEIWGEEIFFETTVESGRERQARAIVKPGEIAFAPDRDVIAIAYGRTPLSKKGETRLWSPSNIWGEALDDVRQLASVRPGAQVEVVAMADPV